MLNTSCRVTQLKSVEDSKRKQYRCVCHLRHGDTITQSELSSKLDSLTSDGRSLQILQDTPLRVLHRRTSLTRPKTIYNLSTEWMSPNIFLLDMQTSAVALHLFLSLHRVESANIDLFQGMYVKEFVHGDFGRTVPNVCSLTGKTADIFQLDVLGIEFSPTS